MGHRCKLQRLSRLGSITARQSSSERQPSFAALSRGRRLCSPRWALAHISSYYSLSCKVEIANPGSPVNRLLNNSDGGVVVLECSRRCEYVITSTLATSSNVDLMSIAYVYRENSISNGRFLTRHTSSIAAGSLGQQFHTFYVIYQPVILASDSLFR